MAKMMMLRKQMHSDNGSRWSNLLPRKQSPGTLPPPKAKLAVLTRPGKNSKESLKRESQIAVSATPPATAKFSRGNGCALPPVSVLSLVPAPAKRRPRDRTQRKILLKQFRFQSFKKCFRLKCDTIIVPGDFKPCSPRRMFCSQECFEAHWKEKLAGNLWNAC